MSALSGIFGRNNDTKISDTEKKVFTEQKNLVSKEVHKQALLWFNEASYTPKAGDVVDTKKEVFCYATDKKTKQPLASCVRKEQLLLNVKGVDSDKIINSLNKTERAAFDFCLNNTIKKYNTKEMKMATDVIMEVEGIKSLKDSAILKVATLQFLQNHVEEKYLDDKYYKLWTL